MPCRAGCWRGPWSPETSSAPTGRRVRTRWASKRSGNWRRPPRPRSARAEGAPDRTGRCRDSMEERMTVVKWDPYRDVWSLQDRVGRQFQESLGPRQGQEDQAGQWTPPVDIFENAERIGLRADLP